MNRHTHTMLTRLEALGISTDDALALRRIAMALHRWNERECNGEVERDEATGRTYSVHNTSGPGPIRRYPCPDLERGAQKRLARIMAKYPTLAAYEQGDPRGAALYIYEKEALTLRKIRWQRDTPITIDSCYSSIGTAVYS